MRQVTRRGDTLIEVMLSISIFAMVALITINMMNDGVNTAQRTLEAEMARNEIDAQAEALRFIHNSYVSERQKMTKDNQFKKVWNTLIENAVRPSQTKDNKDLINDNENLAESAFDINNMTTCEQPYGNGSNHHLNRYNAFILNTRLIVPDMSAGDTNFQYLENSYADLINHMAIYHNKTSSAFSAPSLYPRIIYKKLSGDSSDNTAADTASLDQDMSGGLYNDVAVAEGIWIDAVGNNDTIVKRSDYFDFYIRTCWHSVGTRVPSTITTVVRLYNPEIME